MTEQENGKAATDRQAEQTADETLQAFATTESSENRQALNDVSLFLLLTDHIR